jgi:hypothetical protein
MQHQPKWRARLAGSSTTDSFLSLTDPAIEEEVTHLIGRDRAKATVRKRKGKKGSSSQSEPSSVVDDIMYTLKKLDISFTKAQM